MKNNNQRGMALLVVLMITAMMTITAVNMNDHWLRAFNRATSTQFYQQSKWLLLSMESLVQHQQLSPLPIDKIHRANLGHAPRNKSRWMEIRSVSVCGIVKPVLISMASAGAVSLARKQNPSQKQKKRKKKKEKKKETEEPLAPYSQLVFQHLLLAQGLHAAEAQKLLLRWLTG